MWWRWTRIPNSALLSHDRFEGVFARAGLASDVEVVEEFPARSDVSALWRHRWTRGKGQVLPWIFGSGPRLPDATHGFDAKGVGRSSSIPVGRR